MSAAPPAAGSADDDPLGEVAVLGPGPHRVEHADAEPRRRVAVPEAAQVDEPVAGRVQGHLGDQRGEDERRHPDDRAAAVAERSVEVLAALQADVRAPAARVVAAQVLRLDQAEVPPVRPQDVLGG